MTRALFALALLALSSQACFLSYPAGGPFYYRRTNSYFVPIQPVDPLPKAEAESLPKYGEAFFDAQGRILRWVEHEDGRVRAVTSYSYRPDKSFEERVCWQGTLTITVYRDRGGISSQRFEGGCTPQ